MLVFSSHEVSHTHIQNDPYIHTYIHAYTHMFTQTHTHIHIHAHRLRTGRTLWREARNGYFRRELSVYNTRWTRLAVLPTFLPCSCPCFWNEPCILEPLPIDEGGKTSELQLDLASWRKLFLNFGCLHSVWRSQWCREKMERERKRKNRGQERGWEQDWQRKCEQWWEFQFIKELVLVCFPQPPCRL